MEKTKSKKRVYAIEEEQQEEEEEEEDERDRRHRGRHSTSVDFGGILTLDKVPKTNRPVTSRPRFYYYVGMFLACVIFLILLISIANLVLNIVAL